MKKSFQFIFSLIASCLASAQIISFPDANFKSKLLSSTANNNVAKNAAGVSIKIDTNSDGEVQYSEALLVHMLNVNHANIASLVGIENFINLENLSCEYNNLTQLNIGNLTNLKGLYCNNNAISSLTETDNLVNLIFINIDNNPLTTINLSNLINLESLFCANTLLTQIDICGTKVNRLWCYLSPLLTTLKLKNNVVSPVAQYSNPLGSPPLLYFDISNLPSLSYICYDDGEYDSIAQGIGYIPNTLTLTTACIACSPTSIINLKLNVQGYFDSTQNKMKSVKYNQGWVSAFNEVDVINIELRNTAGVLISSTNTVLKTDGTAIGVFKNVPSGLYYIGVKSSNSVRTWSATLQVIGTTPLTYDYTNSASKAYGNNLIELSNGVFGLYSGDINNDGNVDNSDYSVWEIDANNFAFGFYATDLNGDGNVDNSDFSIWETNNNNFIYSVTPFP